MSRTGIQVYASAKAAQIGLTRQLAHELGPCRALRSTASSPGFVDRTRRPYASEAVVTGGRRGTVTACSSICIALSAATVRPADIADAALFFASDHA